MADRTRVTRCITILTALVAVLVGCSAQPTVTIYESAAAQDDTSVPEELLFEDPAEPSSEDVEPAATEAATTEAATTEPSATGEPVSAAVQVDAPGAEQEEKAERRAAYDAFRRELFATLLGTEERPETDRVPDPDALASAATGDTLRTTTTIELVGQPEQPIVLITQSNETMRLTHTTAEHDDYVRLLAARFGQGDAVSGAGAPTSGGSSDEPGVVETVVLASDGYSVWSRGLTTQVARTAYAPLDASRWYVGDALSSAAQPFYGTTTEVWDLVLTPMPDATFAADGSSVRVASLVEPARVGLFGFASNNFEGVPVTMTTVTDASDQLVSIALEFDGTDLASVRFDLSDRGAPLDLPEIVDVLKDPRDTNHIAADSYSWTATGTTFEADGDRADSRWNVQGHYADAYLSDILTMTVGDAAKLAGVTLDQTSPDQLIQRKGFEGTTYTVGLAPELLPAWAYPEVDPGAEYFNDIFGVPTHIFPSGLSEYALWSSLRTVPTVEDRRGWAHHRVTVGSVDPEYWNWRHREGDGFFSWILSEDPAERFEVTIGANTEGRIERFELRTIDPDGGGLRFDITIDAVKTEPPVVEVSGRPTNLSVDPAWAEDTVAAEEAGDVPDIDAFFEASRAEYPTIEHARRPEHLTLLLERVKDEPSGAYTPEGEHYRWPSVYFADRFVGSLSDTGQSIVCLELEDNEWRFTDNDFENFWRGYTDGSSLDGLILRYNTNAWMSVDVYGSDGDRHAGDPCAFAPAW